VKREHFNGIGPCDALNRDCGLDCHAYDAPAPPSPRCECGNNHPDGSICTDPYMPSQEDIDGMPWVHVMPPAPPAPPSDEGWMEMKSYNAAIAALAAAREEIAALKKRCDERTDKCIALEQTLAMNSRRVDKAEAERDAAVKELASIETHTKKLSLQQFMDLQDEVARLKRVIEDAPHGDECALTGTWGKYVDNVFVPDPCNCWKALAKENNAE